MPRKREDRWIGSAQVYVDHFGFSRAVLINEDEDQYLLIGPIGTTGVMRYRTGTEAKLKRAIEKELHDAGY